MPIVVDDSRTTLSYPDKPLLFFEIRNEEGIPYAAFPISTGKLEGFNNKIKVAKRTGFGYRNGDYFFTLIRFLSIPDHGFHRFC